MFLSNSLRLVAHSLCNFKRINVWNSDKKYSSAILLTSLITVTTGSFAQELSNPALETLPSDLIVNSDLASEESTIIASQSTQARVIGGTQAAVGKWPSLVAVVMPGDQALQLRQFCGGSIVADRWVLTAAHCMFNQDGSATTPDQVRIVAGINDLDDATAVETVVTNVYVHPQYENNIFPINDIALLELATSVAEPENALLNGDPETLVGRNAYIAGWGAITLDGPVTADWFPNLLQEASMPIVSREQCNLPQSYDGNIIDTQLCAGFREGGVDSCQGDSGGPIYILEGTEQVQIGVTSFGAGCALPNLYGVYTSVDAFRSWIDDYINVTGGAAKATGAVGVGGNDFAGSTHAYFLTLLASFSVLSLLRNFLSMRRKNSALVVLTLLFTSACSSSLQKPEAVDTVIAQATESKSIVARNSKVSISNAPVITLSDDDGHVGFNQLLLGATRMQSVEALASLGFDLPSCNASKTALKGTGRLFLQEQCETKPRAKVMLEGLDIDVLKFHILDDRLVKLEANWLTGDTTLLTSQLNVRYEQVTVAQRPLEWRLGNDHIRVVTSGDEDTDGISGMSLQMIDGRLEGKLPSLFDYPD